MRRTSVRRPATRHAWRAEALRYYRNAENILKRLKKEHGRYSDPKYVSMASGTGYLAALKAIEAYLHLSGKMSDGKPKFIEDYRALVKKHIPHNGKLMAALDTVYDDLHLGGYYRENMDVNVIKSGMESCKKIIDLLLPYSES